MCYQKEISHCEDRKFFIKIENNTNVFRQIDRVIYKCNSQYTLTTVWFTGKNKNAKFPHCISRLTKIVSTMTSYSRELKLDWDRSKVEWFYPKPLKQKSWTASHNFALISAKMRPNKKRRDIHRNIVVKCL